jgi:putative phage-type endonuclease
LKTVELVQGTPEWHAWRLTHLGGSEAAAVLGECPYRTPRQLWADKKGWQTDLEDDPSKEYIFAKGHQVEGMIRKDFAELIEEEITPVCIESEAFPVAGASLDGIGKRAGLLEAKLVGAAVLERAVATGEIPRHHWIQVHHQFLASDGEIDIAHWFGHNGKRTGGRGALVPIRPDKAFIAELREAEARFWDLVQRDIMPALHERDFLVPEDDADRILFDQLLALKHQRDEIDERFNSLKEAVAKKFKHPRMAWRGMQMIRVERSGSINYAKIPEIQALKPEYLEQFRGKGSVSWTLRETKEKKNG